MGVSHYNLLKFQINWPNRRLHM